MTNLKTFSIFLAFSATGLIDSLYLVFKYYSGSAPECVILIGCDVVAKSQYAEIFNIPVALLGAIYYSAILLLTIIYLKTKREGIFKFTAYFTIIGFLVSLWFLYLQLFIIRAICFYCLISAATSTALFISGIIFIAKIRKVKVQKLRFGKN